MSGKFATNALVMALGVFAYNILRLIGQTPTATNRDPGFDVPGLTADQHRSAFQPTLPGLHRVQRGVLAAGYGQLGKQYESRAHNKG